MALFGKFLLVLLAIAAVVAVIIVYYVYQKKMKLTPNIAKSGIFVHNYLSNFTDGHEAGWEHSVRQHSSGRLICKFWSIHNLNEPELKTVVVERGMRRFRKNGDLSIVSYLPLNADELPKEQQNTEIGKLHAEIIASEKANKTIFDGLREKDKTVTRTVRDLAKSSLDNDLLERAKALTEQPPQPMFDGKREKKSGHGS